MSEHREIDVLFQGEPHAVTCHEVDGWLVDPGPESSFATLCEALGDEQPRGVLLTHIHLDHAGAAGALVERWPSLEVWVHRIGAPHVIDPSRLVASATRIYGAEMERLWGRIVPVPEGNVHVLDESAAAHPEGFRWAYTPGHAVHHVAFLHESSGLALCGDVAGVRIGDGPILPPTPPPDIDIEAWHDSIDLVSRWNPTGLALTHAGTYTDVREHLMTLHDELEILAAVARRSGEAEFEATIRERFKRAGDQAGYLKAMPPDTQYGGLARYWTKRDNRPST